MSNKKIDKKQELLDSHWNMKEYFTKRTKHDGK